MLYDPFPSIEPGTHRLPPLPYAYDALEPIIDAQTMRIHHDQLHKQAVDALNQTELALVAARKNGNYSSIKCLEKDLAFFGSGDILHSIYWTIMTYPNMGGAPDVKFLNWINWSFGGFEAFKAQFSAAAKNVEASGWCILGYNPAFGRLDILQCEKHQDLTLWGIIPILVCDVWEHAYFLQYKSALDTFVDAWWKVVNWKEVQRRFADALNGRLTLY